MHLHDLPLVARHDLERLGLDPSATGLVVDADSNSVTLHLTHDQLTGFATRMEEGAEGRAYRVRQAERDAERAEIEAEEAGTEISRLEHELTKVKAELATVRAQACHLGHCARAGITS